MKFFLRYLLPEIIALPSGTPTSLHSLFSSLPTDMESAIKTIVTTFLSSARGKENLDSKTFQKMVKSQLSGVMEDTNSSSAIKEMQQGLDSDSDGKVDFQEYLSLIGYIANSMSQSKSEPTANSS
ncbi:hypothetical protein CCH79_00010989 [Gambusia affinis]|uniref:EF-hand domain-containing protein n=1 Tax=Gambusia affinis TaxID=33528 RepID=A0A315VLR5_GAMAF|nr:hypothetical protein CCH79_00010989 [Gambusia affinis]